MAAEYQHASDFIYGHPPFSGVIRTSDGKFIACQAVTESPDWQTYLDWAAADPANVPDPYLAPEAGGAVLTLAPEDVPVGSMHDSLPLAPEVTEPRMVDVPFVSGTPAVGEMLAVTMGNWEGEPTSYNGQWVQVDTETLLGAGAEHLVTLDDQGHDIACIVTATNGYGSTRAPLSNVVSIPAAVPPAVLFDDGVTTDDTSRRSVPRHEPTPEPEPEHHRRSHHRQE